MMTEPVLTVAYAAAPDRQVEIQLAFLSGETILEAILRSGILEEFPEIDLGDKHKGDTQKGNKVGIFSKLCALDDEPRPGDRIEIYRPLKIDPKQARRDRARDQN